MSSKHIHTLPGEEIGLKTVQVSVKLHWNFLKEGRLLNKSFPKGLAIFFFKFSSHLDSAKISKAMLEG